MDAFLSSFYHNLSHITEVPVSIVIGNESCDLDSVASAIAIAFLFEKLQNRPFVPLLHLKSFDELPIRGDIMFWLQRLHLGPFVDKTSSVSQRLPCLYEWLEPLKLAIQNVPNLIVVDHQPGSGAPALKNIYAKVTHVYDHHFPLPKDKAYEQYEVLEVGSCSTIVAKKYAEAWTQLISNEQNLPGALTALKLLYGAILLDTEACQPNNYRTTEKDVDMMQWIEHVLMKYACEDFTAINRPNLLKELEQRKFNDSALTVWQMLRKDVKYIYHDNRPFVAVPSIFNVEVDQLVALPDFQSDFHKELQNFPQPLMLIVANVCGSTGRYLVIFADNSSAISVGYKENLLTYLLENKEAQAALGAFRHCGASPLRHYGVLKLSDPRLTRKVILPQIEKYISSPYLRLHSFNSVLITVELTEDDASCLHNIDKTYENDTPANSYDNSPCPEADANAFLTHVDPEPTSGSTGLQAQFLLPTLNNRRMLEKVALKRQEFNYDEEQSPDEAEELPDPIMAPSPLLFTPDNSDEEVEEDGISVCSTSSSVNIPGDTNPSRKQDRSLPTLNNKDMIERVSLKRESMKHAACCGESFEHRLTPDLDDQGHSIFTPHNSFVEERATILHGMTHTFGCIETNHIAPSLLEEEVFKKREQFHLETVDEIGDFICTEKSESSSAVAFNSCRRVIIPSQKIDLEITGPIKPSTLESAFIELEQLDYAIYHAQPSTSSQLSSTQPMGKEEHSSSPCKVQQSPSPVQNTGKSRGDGGGGRGSNTKRGSKRLLFRAEPPPDSCAESFLSPKPIKIDVHPTDHHPAVSQTNNDAENNGFPFPRELAFLEEANPKHDSQSLDQEVKLKLIESYLGVITHGGFYNNPLDMDRRTAIIVFNACRLPIRHVENYDLIIDILFRFIVHNLESQVPGAYSIVYFHGGSSPEQTLKLRLLLLFHSHIHARLRKELRHFYIVHPPFWSKPFLFLSRPFLSGKFYKKVIYVQSLRDLADLLPTEFIQVPEDVIRFDLLLAKKSRNK